jgi:predicted metalloprotease with PDZ domain
MRMNRLFARTVLLLLLAPAGVTAARAQPSCSGGRVVADYGYQFISCVDCLSITRIRGVEYATFTDEPVLHRIRADGPAAGKLVDGDTLVSVDGYRITTIEAAIRFSEWRNPPVTLVVRRNGVERRVSIDVQPLCVPNRPFMAPVARGARLGIAMECVGCRISRTTAGAGQRWEYRSPPAIAQVMPGGPGDRAGIRVADTLLAVDGFPIVSVEAGERLGSIRPGHAMEWRLKRGERIVVATIVPVAEDARGGDTGGATGPWSVGNVMVQASGAGVRASRNDSTGALTIRGDSVTVIVSPPTRRPYR